MRIISDRAPPSHEPIYNNTRQASQVTVAQNNVEKVAVPELGLGVAPDKTEPHRGFEPPPVHTHS